MPPRRIDPARVSGALNVEHCDIPGELTLTEWRRQCSADRRAAAQTSRHVKQRPLTTSLRRALRLG